MDETKVTATLPNLDIEMTRRAAPDGQSELVTIQMRATPSFDAFAQVLTPQTMMAPFLAANPFFNNPFVAAWSQAVTKVWAPWTALLPGKTE